MTVLDHARRIAWRPILPAAILLATAAAGVHADALPMPDHVVIVVEENRSFSNIIGNPQAPYINSLVAQGALMTSSFGMGHPSQPNYLQLFSGSNQGVTDNSTPHSFDTPNLRSSLAAGGFSFTGYAESLPNAGFTGSAFSTVPGQNQYERKHNPWVNWQGAAANAVPASENQPFTSFPANHAHLPTVSFVVPNEQNNMHDGSIATADGWLNTKLKGYVDWAQTHNSLFILTWDEDDGSENNRIVTLLVGPMVVPGQYNQTINHLNVLRTVTNLYGVAPVGHAVGVQPIGGIFVTSPVPEPSALALLCVGLPGLWLRRRAAMAQRRSTG